MVKIFFKWKLVMKIIKNKTCRMCFSKKFDTVVNLGKHPLVNSLVSRKEAERKLPDYFIILAPNYSDVILNKEKNFRKNGGKFIIPKNGIIVK